MSIAHQRPPDDACDYIWWFTRRSRTIGSFFNLIFKRTQRLHVNDPKMNRKQFHSWNQISLKLGQSFKIFSSMVFKFPSFLTDFLFCEAQFRSVSFKIWEDKIWFNCTLYYILSILYLLSWNCEIASEKNLTKDWYK